MELPRPSILRIYFEQQFLCNVREGAVLTSNMKALKNNQLAGQNYYWLETESLTVIFGLKSASIIAWEVSLPFGHIRKYLWVPLVEISASHCSCLASANQASAAAFKKLVKMPSTTAATTRIREYVIYKISEVDANKFFLNEEGFLKRP